MKSPIIAELAAKSSAEIAEILRKAGINPQPTIDAVKKLVEAHRSSLHAVQEMIYSFFKSLQAI